MNCCTGRWFYYVFIYPGRVGTPSIHRSCRVADVGVGSGTVLMYYRQFLDSLPGWLYVMGDFWPLSAGDGVVVGTAMPADTLICHAVGGLWNAAVEVAQTQNRKRWSQTARDGGVCPQFVYVAWDSMAPENMVYTFTLSPSIVQPVMSWSKAAALIKMLAMLVTPTLPTSRCSG
jgi:hypothetical protein